MHNYEMMNVLFRVGKKLCLYRVEAYLISLLWLFTSTELKHIFRFRFLFLKNSAFFRNLKLHFRLYCFVHFFNMKIQSLYFALFYFTSACNEWQFSYTRIQQFLYYMQSSNICIMFFVQNFIYLFLQNCYYICLWCSHAI